MSYLAICSAFSRGGVVILSFSYPSRRPSSLSPTPMDRPYVNPTSSVLILPKPFRPRTRIPKPQPLSLVVVPYRFCLKAVNNDTAIRHRLIQSGRRTARRSKWPTNANTPSHRYRCRPTGSTRGDRRPHSQIRLSNSTLNKSMES